MKRLLVDYETGVLTRQTALFREATGQDIGRGGMLEYRIAQCERLIDAADSRKISGATAHLTEGEIENLWKHHLDGCPINVPYHSPESVVAVKEAICARVRYYEIILREGDNKSKTYTALLTSVFHSYEGFEAGLISVEDAERDFSNRQTDQLIDEGLYDPESRKPSPYHVSFSCLVNARREIAREIFS